MLTDDYKKSVCIMGRVTTLAELDILLRTVTLVVCIVTLTINCIRLSRQ